MIEFLAENGILLAFMIFVFYYNIQKSLSDRKDIEDQLQDEAPLKQASVLELDPQDELDQEFFEDQEPLEPISSTKELPLASKPKSASQDVPLEASTDSLEKSLGHLSVWQKAVLYQEILQAPKSRKRS